jgi:hypothetical protein
MKIEIILIVILLSIIVTAQNTYSVQPGVKNNKIVLELSNVSSTESANNLEVKLIRSSQNLTFNQTEKIIENITQGTETEATFNFDVAYSIENIEADTIEFMITNNQSVYLTKQFILQYSLPIEYKLEQNYPNPFNPTTKIRYSIPNVLTTEEGNQNIVLKIYDILGNEVTTLVNEQKEPGYYEVDFNASGFASGVYIYRLIANNYVSVKKMMVLK